MPHPPPRRDIPRPTNMTEEKYAAFMAYLAADAPDIWRDSDGTIYLSWVPSEVYQSSRSLIQANSGIKPDNPDYGRFLDDLLPHFDYKGLEVPRAASTHHDAKAR